MKNPLIRDSFDYEYLLAPAEEEAMEIKRRLICPVHRRKVRMCCDYDNDGINAHITGYCCKEFAAKVREALEELELFDRISIEKLNTLPKRPVKSKTT